jgi:DNA-directed RNA polymerase specialized sigma24 family protein
MTSDPHRAIEAVWRIESARLIAGLARIVGDVGVVENLAQDALVAALERWPESGVPDNPGAWLMAAAKHRAIDHMRRRKLVERKHAELGAGLTARQASPEAELAAAIDDAVGDDLLRLVFISCHPVLSTEARAALTLRLLGGLRHCGEGPVTDVDCLSYQGWADTESNRDGQIKSLFGIPLLQWRLRDAYRTLGLFPNEPTTITESRQTLGEVLGLPRRLERLQHRGTPPRLPLPVGPDPVSPLPRAVAARGLVRGRGRPAGQ